MGDYIVRATAAGAELRAFAATTREIAETARKAHNTSPVVTAALGRLMTAGVIMGAMQKGDADLVTLQIQGGGPVKGLTVTADSHANVKGYATVPEVIIPANSKGKLDVAGAIGPGFLTVIKDLGLKEPYTGQTMLQTSEIAEDLTYYFASSEQIPSTVGLGVLMEKNNTVKQAGGFIIQLMPFASDATITKLEQNLASVDSVTKLLDAGNSPEQILEILLAGMDMEIVDTIPVRFYCNCSKERVAKALYSIAPKDMQEMINDGKKIEVNCHFCNKNYNFSVEELKEIKRLRSQK